MNTRTTGPTCTLTYNGSQCPNGYRRGGPRTESAHQAARAVVLAARAARSAVDAERQNAAGITFTEFNAPSRPSAEYVAVLERIGATPDVVSMAKGERPTLLARILAVFRP